MRLRPPIITNAAQIVTIAPPITVAHVYSFPAKLNATSDLIAILTAEVIPLICVIVPIPRRPAATPKIANKTASHFHFEPIPFSIV